MVCTQRRWNIMHNTRGVVGGRHHRCCVVVLFLVLTNVAVLLSRAFKHTKEHAQAPRMRLFGMRQANVRSISLGEGIVASIHMTSCEDHLPGSVETKVVL